MKCPFCNQENTRVIDSRPVPDNNSIRRRRQCDECGKRFTTYEKIETIPLTVIKKDQSREEYDRAKIQDGVMRACYKRPISVEQIEKVIDDIETEIFNKEEREMYIMSIPDYRELYLQKRDLEIDLSEYRHRYGVDERQLKMYNKIYGRLLILEEYELERELNGLECKCGGK